MARWHLACDVCGAEAWVGQRGRRFDAWCEACQRPATLAHEALSGEPCPHCGVALDRGSLRFEELYGELQHLAAVLDAWCGDPAPLGAILPDRPRFITDLNPPGPRSGDPPGLGGALQALAAGRFDAALNALAGETGSDGDARRFRARAIALERRGDLAGAEAAWDTVLAAGDDPVARLARGALRARRAAFDAAREDLAHAGDAAEACWNRAALTIVEAVAHTPGLPDPSVIARARDLAPPASSYWSEHTVGRLLWVLLVERAESRRREGHSACPDERVMRAAEMLLEFDTFWDQALVLHGYVVLGMHGDAARVAASLAHDLAQGLLREPCVCGPAAHAIADALRAAAAAVASGTPEHARAHVAALLARDDVRRYRIPCAACGRGTVGVDRVDDADPADVSATA